MQQQNQGRGPGGRGNYTGGRGGSARGGQQQQQQQGRGGRGRGGGRSGPSGRGRGGRGGGRGPPPATNAVPYGYLPAYLPGAASLVEQLNKRILCILRDGRHLVGTLGTFDQFSNMVMMDTCERRVLVVPNKDDEMKKKNEDDDDDGTDTNTNGTMKPSASSKTSTLCYQTDIQLGLFIVRGDNVVLLGEVGDEEDEVDTDQIKWVTLEEFEELEDEEAERKENSGESDAAINWDFDMDLVA